MKTYVIETDPLTEFTEPLGVNAVETEVIKGLRADGRGYIKNVALRTVDNSDWRVELWDGNSNIIAFHNFINSDGMKNIVSGIIYYCYSIPVNWAVPLNDGIWTTTMGIRSMSVEGTNGSIKLLLLVEK